MMRCSLTVENPKRPGAAVGSLKPKNVAPGQGGLTGRRKRRLGESDFGRGTKTGQSEGGSTDRFGLI